MYDPRWAPIDFGVRKVNAKLGKFEFVATGRMCPFRTGLVGRSRSIFLTGFQSNSGLWIDDVRPNIM